MMTIKRALVVDDSRSARVALKRLLEEHNLEVALAESGEDALEYLKKHDVDVVFMDHTMPGMDGLEAVSAIKANPKTATIPVMMYTTREGEVYVGQARALGAVGVLPKNVQPHQLFEMLHNLGLVKDRRESALEQTEAQTADAAVAEVLDEVDRELEERALGMSVQALVTRILEDQHMTLRADILRSQKSFAKQVAQEIVKERGPAADGPEAAPAAAEPARRRPLLAAAAVIGLVVSSFLAWQFKTERDQAIAQIIGMETSRAALADTQSKLLRGELSIAQARSEDLFGGALAALQWAANMDNSSDMHDAAFSAELADRVRGLMPHLRELGFSGELTLTSHLGRFCLVVDDAGNYQLAPEEMPMLSCDYMGHVLEDSDYVSDRLSVQFAQLLREQPLSGPPLRLAALDAGSSQPLLRYPDTNATAGEWNAIARANNRVEVELGSNTSLAQN